MTDAQGHEISPGDTLAVARRQGSSTWIDKVTVVSIIDDKPTYVDRAGRVRAYSGSSSAVMIIRGRK